MQLIKGVPWILLFAVITTMDSCVLTKKYKVAQAKIDSLTDLTNRSNYTIPNPPPMPSQSTKISCDAISRIKTFEDADNIITEAFKVNKEEQYYFNFHGGFAIATPPEPIDGNGIIQTSPNDRSKHESTLSSFFAGAREHLSNLFFGTTEYSRFIVIIVSPNLNGIGGAKGDWNAWFETKYTKLPDSLIKRKLPPRTTIYALLYEFKKNSNEDAADQVFGAKCLERIDDINLVLSICNSQKLGKD
jgi:hypothetical protein